MKTFSLATRVDYATKKYFVDKASSLGITLCEYVSFHLEGSLCSEQKIEQLKEEKKALEEQNMQLQKALAKPNQAQAAKSKMQLHIERIMQQNDAILGQHFQQRQTMLKKEQLQQQGFNFDFATCITGHKVFTMYNYGYSLQEEQVQIHRMTPRENL